MTVYLYRTKGLRDDLNGRIVRLRFKHADHPHLTYLGEE
jgi:hypothetical protein